MGLGFRVGRLPCAFRITSTCTAGHDGRSLGTFLKLAMRLLVLFVKSPYHSPTALYADRSCSKLLSVNSKQSLKWASARSLKAEIQITCLLPRG